MLCFSIFPLLRYFPSKEIDKLKKSKILLVKQKTKENTIHREKMNLKKKEMLHLEKRKRKQDIEYQRLNAIYQKQTNVLKKNKKDLYLANRKLKEVMHANTSKTAEPAVNAYSLRKSLDSMLTLALNIDLKRMELEQFKEKRLNTKQKLDELIKKKKDEEKKEGKKDIDAMINEYEGTLRMYSANISVLNNDINSSKDNIDTIESLFQSGGGASDGGNVVEMNYGLKYLFKSLVHRAKKTIKSNQQVKQMKKKIHSK
jgi:hypothetical protein